MISNHRMISVQINNEKQRLKPYLYMQNKILFVEGKQMLYKLYYNLR
jgi:hypothetical protein